MGPELLGKKETHLLWIKIIRSSSGRPHNSANIFWDVKYHYDTDFCVNRGHKSTRKMEGDDVSKERLIPILVLLIKACSLLGPHIYKDRQVGDVKVKGILSCSDLEIVKAQDPERTEQGRKKDRNPGLQESRL